MEKRANPISATVDFERDGVQHGFLRLPHSRDDSAWGAVMIPITVAKNGKGPTVLLTGANHGDEYEGPVALMNLASSIDPAELSGRVIIVPAMNYPAFRAATRTSPIDKGNLNRIFPGKPDGGVTEKIADYFQRTLLPLADIVLDIHSGGKTLEFVPFCCAHRLPDPKHEAACVAAMRAFNAPYSMMLLEIDNVGMYDTAAEEMGKVFISTELGGGGTTRAGTVVAAKRGVRNLLIHAGLLEGKAEQTPSQMLDMPGGECFIFSEQDGLIEPCVDLAQPVRKGDVIAQIWAADR
ncbi:MAG TPA: N(2)-acetyl-L-2,4-diaminobutanoate deacetylase DoeB, partial [Dongiaceae bacterium]|nr:N(2)-acetyl-L-2,4-diaminobutanoate deacetylase DoeB [Dongiaceae bacterium]